MNSQIWDNYHVHLWEEMKYRILFLSGAPQVKTTGEAQQKVILILRVYASTNFNLYD